MSFLVVAIGHSGTQFLAEQLGRAPGWKVEHEPDRFILPATCNWRFSVKNYGEVNSRLLNSARHIVVDHKAVLIRNPYEVARSIFVDSMFKECPKAVLTYVHEALSQVDSLIRDDYHVIRFSEITTDVDAVVEAARKLGIETLRPSMCDLKKRNPHLKKMSSLGRFNKLLEEEVILEEFDWFIRAYKP